MSIEVLNKMTATPEETPVINVALGNPIYRGPKGDKGDIGPTGLTGATGPEGPAGKDGYTPIKGVDYFTEEDKAELMVNAKDNIIRLQSDVIPSEEEWEKLKEIYNAKQLLYPIYMNGYPVLSIYSSGSFSLGGSLGLFAPVEADNYNNASDYYFTFNIYWYDISDTKPPQKCRSASQSYFNERMISLPSSRTPGSKKNILDALNYLDTKAVVSSAVSYDNSESNIENIETVQKALDFLFDISLDEIAVENILSQKGYQTEEQVIALIQEYGGGGGDLPAAEGVEF